MVFYTAEIYVRATDGRVLLGYRDLDWNGDVVAFRNAKLLEEEKRFK